MKKLIIKIIVLLIIFFLIFHFNNLIFTKKSASITSWTQFYKNKESKFDIIFIGSSISYTSFDPKVINANTGLNAYNLSSSSISMEQVYYNIKEIIKYNKPQLFVIEAHSLDIETSNIGKRLKANFQNIDGQKLTFNKIQSVFDVFESKDERLQALFPIIRNHNEWSNLDLLKENQSYKFSENRNLGFRPMSNKGYKERIKKTLGKPLKKYTISDNNKAYLEKISEICIQNNIELLLARAPQVKYQNNLDYSKEIYNETTKLCSDLGIKYLDYNKQYNKYKFKDLDFYDALHLNSIGAGKLTNILLNDINQSYSLKNNKNKIIREPEYYIKNGEFKNNLDLLSSTYNPLEGIVVENIFIKKIINNEYCLFVCFNKDLDIEQLSNYRLAIQFYPEDDQIKLLDTKKERKRKRMSSGHLTNSIIETDNYYVVGIGRKIITPKRFKSFRFYLYDDNNSTEPSITLGLNLE